MSLTLTPYRETAPNRSNHIMSDGASDRGPGESETAAGETGRAGSSGVRRSAGVGPRKVNRRDPEKRREQNRAAQKVYRTYHQLPPPPCRERQRADEVLLCLRAGERQKQKLRDLETQLHQVQQTHQRDEPAVSAPPPMMAEPTAFTVPTTVAPADLSSFPASSFPMGMEAMPAADAGFDMDMGGMPPMFPDLLQTPTPPYAPPETDFLTSILQGAGPMFDTDSLYGALSGGGQDPFSVLRSNNSWLSAGSWASDAKTIPWRPARPSSLGMRSRPSEAGAGDEVIEVERRPAKGAAWHGDTIIHCSCLDYHEPLGRCMGKVQVFPDPMTVRWRAPTPEDDDGFSGQPRLPDVHRNAIQVHQMCVMDAMLRNLVLIGVPVELFCAEETESPFYRYSRIGSSSGGGGGDDEAATKAVQLSFRGLKHDLRPSRIQVARSHHPYIDVFPIPSVRKRLIELQHEIDEDAFFIDAIKGFRCWGSRRDSHRDPVRGTGSPWDMRSWEATPEFLEKWACVLGDDEGEMARQSRWWRVMRGEEED